MHLNSGENNFLQIHKLPMCVLLLLSACLMFLLNYAQAQNPKPPVLMISVDGMRPDYITQADAHQLKVPILRGFIRDGCYADGVAGVLPTVTFPSHTTLVTGAWPIEHGVYNNARFDPLTRHPGDWYWYAPDIRVPTLWQVASKAGISTASVFWPVTVNASHIEYLVPAYPARTRDDHNLMEALSRPDGYLSQLEKRTGAFYIVKPVTAFDELLTEISIDLIREKKPGFMTLHLVSLDAIEHATGPFSSKSNAAMEAIDGMIGRLVAAERANNSQAIIVIVSDHGFIGTHSRVNLLIPFIKAGLITLKTARANTKPAVASWRAIIWNADGTAYVILHDPHDAKTQNEVATLLARLKADPSYGIARVLSQKEIIAEGGDPHASFMVAWEPGFEGGGALQGAVVKAISGTGTHGYLPEFPQMRSSFFAIGSGIAWHRDVGIIDMRQIAPTVAGFMGIDWPGVSQPPIRCTSKP
jgi:predicted AlkP superfamily pyrophosphatase or phosphodiesterase